MTASPFFQSKKLDYARNLVGTSFDIETGMDGFKVTRSTQKGHTTWAQTDIEPYDPLTMIATAALMVAVATLAA